MVLHSHGCGGAEKHALHLMQGLGSRGHETIWCGPRDSWLHDAAAAAGIQTRHLPMHGFYDAWSVLRLAWLARRHGAQLIHGHLTRGAYYAGLAARLAGIPAIATAHSTNAVKHFDRCQRVIGVCRGVVDALRNHGYPSERLRVIYNGVPDPGAPGEGGAVRRAEARRRLDLAQDRFVVAMVARYIHDKGHDLLLQAVAQLHDRQPLILLFGDTSGDYYNKIAGEIDRLNLGDSIRVLGQRDDLETLLPAADILVAPSRREAMSLAIIEACAAGLPVVASRVGGIPEIVADGVTGRLVPVADADTLARAITGMMDEPGITRSMGDNARRRYLESFSLDAMVTHTESVYRELVEST